MKNYYQILNVKPTATESEIKNSYRILAKRYHPDVNPNDESAAAKFADINEAHTVLSDQKSRAEYDVKLKEANAPRPNPEDIIARQRAQAQEAARQAARQAAFRNGMGGSAFRDATIARARQAAQAQQAQAQAQAQAQVQALYDQGFRNGREQGLSEARQAAEAEIARLNNSFRTVVAENKELKRKLEGETELKRKLALAEDDRRDLEQELFSRDREFSQGKQRIQELEDLADELREKGGVSRHAKAENAELQAKISDLKDSLRRAESENKSLRSEKEKLEKENAKLAQSSRQADSEIKQAELKSSAQIQLQQDKRRQMQDEIDELHRKLAALTEEAETLRAENEQWQQYAKSEEFISDTERRIQEWTQKTNADKRLAKPTLYADLGVLIWATDAEIGEAYAKLSKRYSGKKDEAIVAKLQKVQSANAVLSDPQKRAEYNATLGITEERIEAERKLIAENESLMTEYRNRLASKEFWARYDEITAAAMSGDAASQNQLGEMYYKGEEIDRDLEQATFWFKEAAKQKHPDAMYHLGVCFVNGEGVERNDATGKGFIRQAAKLGSKLAKLAVEKEKP